MSWHSFTVFPWDIRRNLQLRYLWVLREALRSRPNDFDLMERVVRVSRKAMNIYWLVVVWVIGIFAFIILQGFHIYSFNLSDSVLIAAISGTTLNILGIFAIVAKYIFRKR